MKILKLLNKINLSILISFFFLQISYSTEPIDIWKIDNQTIKEDKVENNETIENQNVITESIFQVTQQNDSTIKVDEEKSLFSKNINIVGIYDPADHDLSMYMWSYSNGLKILELINKINNINLSQDAKEILNIALLTNSYFPTKNISKEQFLKMKTDWLIKNQNFKWSQRISHLAFSILVISIIVNSIFSEEFSVNMKVGQEKIISDSIINFEKISKQEIDNYTSIKAEIEIKQNEDKLKFYPELRLYKTPETITSEADIKTNLFNDNLVVVNYLKNTDYLNIRYQKKPFMLLIWISALILCLGGVIGLKDKLK